MLDPVGVAFPVDDVVLGGEQAVPFMVVPWKAARERVNAGAAGMAELAGCQWWTSFASRSRSW
eukprot:8446815-Lingulodinium_polyedra.AAC.1